RLDLTRTGEVVGSPLYLSPEVIKGEELDPGTDIYSLGCVMYEVLASRSPFERSTVLATISSHLSDPVPALPPTVDFAGAVEPIIR
ncbi:serine/threonine protein kinase, partial [Acinetobacter baumannii]